MLRYCTNENHNEYLNVHLTPASPNHNNIFVSLLVQKPNFVETSTSSPRAAKIKRLQVAML